MIENAATQNPELVLYAGVFVLFALAALFIIIIPKYTLRP